MTEKKDKPIQAYAELPPALDIRKIGRPSSYDPTYCDLVRDLGAEGKSKGQMAAAIGVSRKTLYAWEKAHPEFAEAVAEAVDLALAWWETAGQINMTRQGFNATAYIFQMKNRFREDYRDAVANEVTGKVEVDVKDVSDLEAARRIAFMLGRAVGRKDTEPNAAKPADQSAD